MPPLESNPLSEEDARKLQEKVKALEEALTSTVASNEQKVADLVLERDAEKEKVLQIEKDKRYIVLCCVCVCVCACVLVCMCVCVHVCMHTEIWYNMLAACVNRPYVCSSNMLYVRIIKNWCTIYIQSYSGRLCKI